MPSLLLLVLFYLSFHTCDGRLLGVVHNINSKNLQSRSSRHSTKSVEEVRHTNGATVLPEATGLTAEEKRSEGKAAPAGEGAMEETKDGTVGVDQQSMEAPEEEIDGARGTASGVVRTKSLVTVSWRVPHDTHKGHPGFNIDYDAPRTHPPSHN